MAERTEVFSVTVPGGSGINFYHPYTLSFPDGVVEAVRIDFGPGHVNLVRVVVAYSSGIVVPVSGSGYVRGVNKERRFDFPDKPTGGGWGALIANGDTIPHTVIFTFEVNELEVALAELYPPVILLPIAS